MHKRVLRDSLIDAIHNKMILNDDIFFLSADFGAPALDNLRQKFPDRFINVGIAEQNLINLATGLSLEGYIVYAYAIAPFLSMRAYEQIRINLSITAQLKKLNVNLISVGAGLSYDVTGPTHHCLEDSCVINTLPNISLFSPSDAILAEEFADYTLCNHRPKYIRLDGKAQPVLYSDRTKISFENGFTELGFGKDLCIISTGYMTHIALEIAEKLSADHIDPSVIDLYMLKPFDKDRLLEVVRGYTHIVTMEEAFLDKGGLDTIIASICNSDNIPNRLLKIGFDDRYIVDVGNREYLYHASGLGTDNIIKKIKIYLDDN